MKKDQEQMFIEMKEYLTKTTQLVILSKEIKKGYICHSYIEDKDWHSPMDWPTNQMIIDILEIQNVYTRLQIESLYKHEGLEGPYQLANRNPNGAINYVLS